MATTITRQELIDAGGRIKVACPDCGWTGDGELELVDRYETDYPPIPYCDLREVVVDPESGSCHECKRCGSPLDPESVVRVEEGKGSGRCDDCPGGHCACWVDANEDVLKTEGGWPR